jgi:hypothetical protein
MIKKILLLMLLIMPVKSYTQSKQPLIIDPRLFGSEKINLSDMADDIIYIPLDNAVPFGRITRIKVNENNIYIGDIDAGILKFNRAGKFLGKIGTKGRGPGEYISATSFTVDDLTGNIYILETSTSKIKVYSPAGRFIRDFIFSKEIFGLPSDIEMFNSKIFLNDYSGFAKNIWIVLDSLGKIVTMKINSIPPFELRKDIVMNHEPGGVFEFENDLYYYNSYNDTVFSVSKDLKYYVAFLFAKGKFRVPTRFITNEERRELFLPRSLFQTRKYVLVRYQYLGNYATAVIEKNTSKIYNVSSIINDIDGGVPLAPRCYYYDRKSTREYFVQAIDPLTLKNHIETIRFENGAYRNPNKLKELMAMTSKLDESGNPVLMIVRLKK